MGYSKLLVAPVSLKQTLIRLIDGETGDMIQEWQLMASELEDGMNRFDVEKTGSENTSGEYVIQMEFDGADKDSSIRIFASSINQYNGGSLEINGETYNGDLSFSVYAGSNSFLPAMFLLMAVVLLAGGAVAYLLIYRFKVRFEKAFIFVFLIFFR